jgi:hypothetical protein
MNLQKQIQKEYLQKFNLDEEVAAEVIDLMFVKPSVSYTPEMVEDVKNRVLQLPEGEDKDFLLGLYYSRERYDFERATESLLKVIKITKDLNRKEESILLLYKVDHSKDWLSLYWEWKKSTFQDCRNI